MVEICTLNEEIGERAFATVNKPSSGSLGRTPVKNNPASMPEVDESTSPLSELASQDRSYSTTNITFPKAVKVFITPEAVKVLSAFKDAFRPGDSVQNVNDYERWLDRAIVDRWSWLKSRNAPLTNSSSVLTLSTPNMIIFSASASETHTPLLGVNTGEGSDFDVVATEIRIIEPSFAKSTVRDTLDGMTVDVATTTKIVWTDLSLNMDVQDSTSHSPSKNIAMEKGDLLALACGTTRLNLLDSQRGNTTAADCDNVNLVIATNVTPAVLSLARRWQSATQKLSTPNQDHNIDRADHLDYTWRIIQAAEQQGITTEPSFLGQTGPLLRPPDTLSIGIVPPISILSLREDIGWRILSQLRYYARRLAINGTLETSQEAESPQATPEELQSDIYGHFAKWREWDVPQYDWIDLHCLQTPRQVTQSKLSRPDIAFDSYTINDRKINVSLRKLQASLFDVTALEGQQLGIMSSTGLTCSVWNAQTTDRAVRVQTVNFAVTTIDLGVHVDLIQYLLPVYSSYERVFDQVTPLARTPAKGPSEADPDVRRCLILGIGKMGLSVNAEPLQFAFDIWDTHVVYSMCSNSEGAGVSDRKSSTRDALNLIVQRSRMSVLHMDGSDRNHVSSLPRIFSLTLEGGQAAFFPKLTKPGNRAESKPSASVLVQSISLETAYDPRNTQIIIETWKASRFS